MKVTVTASDIARGERNRSQACPVYFGIKRLFPHQKIWVTILKVYDMTGKPLALLPAKAQQLIARFDAGKKIKPTTFTLAELGR